MTTLDSFDLDITSVFVFFVVFFLFFLFFVFFLFNLIILKAKLYRYLSDKWLNNS